jgi:adenylate kinase
MLLNKYAITMINLILFGPPGSGKGTQAQKLTERYGLIHISTGDLFRYELGNNTPLGVLARSYMDQGQLVPDEVTIGMLRNKVEANPEANGFIFDGFPRTIPQAEALDALLTEKNAQIDKLIMLDVTREEIVERILSRGKTSGRSDDNDPGIISRRFEVYQQETSPVYAYYHQLGKSVKIHGIGDIEDIFRLLCSAIDTI